jgi:toxin-antitoxin system PIN domain toxin
MFVVDTNVLLYATNTASPEHGRCRRLVEEWHRSPSPWCLTWGIVYEFLSASSHRRELERPRSLAEAWKFVVQLLDSPGLEVLIETDRHAAIAAMTFAEVPGLSGRHLHDAHVAILMREHGISRIVTRDTGFQRFPFLEVVDPLTGSWEVHESRPGGPHPSSRARYGRASAQRKKGYARSPAGRSRPR